MEEIFAERTAQVSVQLAHHFEMASLTAKAAEYLCQAAEEAAQLSAHVETIAHLKRGLSLLQELPDSPERARQELRLHILYGLSQVAAKGWASAEVQAAYEQAGAAAQRAGEVQQLVAVLYGLFIVSHVGGDVQTSRAIGEQGLALVKQHGNPALRIVDHFMVMAASLHQGELRAAQAHMQRALELYEPEQHSFLVSTFPLDMGVFAAVYGSHGMWYLAKADAALAQCRQAAMAARASSHPFGETVAHGYLAMLHGFRREWRQAQEWALTTDALSMEHAFPYYHAWAIYVQGWALAEQGEQERGLALMEEGMADFRAMRTGLREPFFLAHLGEAYAKKGDVSKGLHLLEEALAAARKHGERVHEAEILRLRGEFLQLQDHATDAVEALFHQAIETASRQEAKALELRAVISLSRLWQRQGKIQEARQLLGVTYARFTEGFDTSDLLEAKALLDTLREGA
jgi:adenylate cyclase